MQRLFKSFLHSLPSVINVSVIFLKNVLKRSSLREEFFYKIDKHIRLLNPKMFKNTSEFLILRTVFTQYRQLKEICMDRQSLTRAYKFGFYKSLLPVIGIFCFVSTNSITEEIVFPMRQHAHEEYCAPNFAIVQEL